MPFRSGCGIRDCTAEKEKVFRGENGPFEDEGDAIPAVSSLKRPFGASGKKRFLKTVSRTHAKYR